MFPAINPSKSFAQNPLKEEDIKNNKTIEKKHEESKRKFYKESDNNLIEEIIKGDKAKRRNSKEVV